MKLINETLEWPLIVMKIIIGENVTNKNYEMNTVGVYSYRMSTTKHMTVIDIQIGVSVQVVTPLGVVV